MVSLVSPAGAMLPPPPPVPQKRPTLSLKRDSSYLDTDDEAGLSLSTKKLKVAFNDRIDVRVLDEWNDKSLDLVKEEVRLGIDRHIAPPEAKDDVQYIKLLHMLGQDAQSNEPPPSKLLKKYILALESRVSALRDCGKLVMAVLDLSWLGRDDSFVEFYGQFLVLLASAHAKYIPPMMERMVSHFDSLSSSEGRLPGEDLVARATMLDRLHVTLQRVLRRVPSAAGILIRTLKLQFPNDVSTTKAYLQYQTHLLRLAHNTPELQSEIMALITQRLVDLDVQIQRDLDDLDLDEDDKLTQGRRPGGSLDDGYDSDDSDLDSVSESELTMNEEEQTLRDIRIKVAKMDSTQDLLFNHYEPFFRSNTPPKDNASFQQLLSNFDNFIMPNRTRHAQFILFHFAQTSPSYAEHFAQHCIDVTNDRMAATSLRLTACAYVASFISRGSRVQHSLVRYVFTWLAGYLDAIRHVWEPNCVGPDRRSYALYYGISQALLYIFCFRWRALVVGVATPELNKDGQAEEDLVAEGHDLVWLPQIKEIITTNLRSVLNPLKVCSPAIVGEFAKIANHLRFVYVFSLLETNKRIRLGRTQAFRHDIDTIDLGRRETAFDRKTGDAHHQLEAYFPFDPYLLRQSKRWLEGDYNEWKLPKGMEDDPDDDDDDDDDDGEDGEEADGEGYASEEAAYESDEESLPELPSLATVAVV